MLLITAAIVAAQEGHTQIYLIWWVNGQGWYEQPTLPLIHSRKFITVEKLRSTVIM